MDCTWYVDVMDNWMDVWIVCGWDGQMDEWIKVMEGIELTEDFKQIFTFNWSEASPLNI